MFSFFIPSDTWVHTMNGSSIGNTSVLVECVKVERRRGQPGQCCPWVGWPIGPDACQSVAVPGPQRSENCLTMGVETGFNWMWLLN